MAFIESTPRAAVRLSFWPECMPLRHLLHRVLPGRQEGRWKSSLPSLRRGAYRSFRRPGASRGSSRRAMPRLGPRQWFTADPKQKRGVRRIARRPTRSPLHLSGEPCMRAAGTLLHAAGPAAGRVVTTHLPRAFPDTPPAGGTSCTRTRQRRRGSPAGIRVRRSARAPCRP